MFVIDTLKEEICQTLIKKGNNVMITGSTGSGKSTYCKELAKNLNMEPYMVNFGSTQDARCSLLGCMELIKGETKFVKSEFLQKVQQPNTLIILDELSRGSDDAFNIVFPLLDFRKEILIDEINETIKIDPSVRFIATANIGAEYSSTRSLDRALEDRFMIFNLNYISGKELETYIKSCKELTTKQELNLTKMVEVYDFICKLYAEDEISTRLSPRVMINCTDLFEDFSFLQVFDTIIKSYFEDGGLLSSEVNTIKMFMDSKGIV